MHGRTMWLSLVQDFHVPKDLESGTQIVLNGASSHIASTLLGLFFYNLNSLLFWFLDVE